MAKKATMLACEFGITTQAIVNNFAPILFVIFKDNFGISYTFIANLMLLNFMIQLFTDGFSIGIISAFGYRKAGIAAQISVIIGLLILGIMPHFAPIRASLVPAVIFYAFGGGLLEVMVSPIVDSLDDGNKSARMSMLHSFYCWGQMAVVLISTVVIKLFGGGVWWIMTLCWAVIPITNTVLFYLAPIPEAEEEKTETPKSLLRSRIFIMMCLLMMCAGAAEITMAQWASLFAQKGHGVRQIAFWNFRRAFGFAQVADCVQYILRIVLHNGCGVEKRVRGAVWLLAHGIFGQHYVARGVFVLVQNYSAGRDGNV